MMNMAHRTIPLSQMAQRNLKLLESGDYHDFIIRCKDREFKVHRNIVCPQSVMLTTLCDPTWKEGSEGVADLKEENPDTVEKVLHYLYTGTYNGDCHCVVNPIFDGTLSSHEAACESQSRDLLSDIRLYILADYLDIEGLKQQVLDNCSRKLALHFSATIYLEPISIALANTKSDDPGLRRTIIKSCVSHRGQVKECPELEQLLQDQEPVAWALLLEAMEDEEALRLQLIQREAETQNAVMKLQIRERELARASVNLEAAAKLVNDTKQCRNETCVKDFGANLEVYANGYIKGLRSMEIEVLEISDSELGLATIACWAR